VDARHFVRMLSPTRMTKCVCFSIITSGSTPPHFTLQLCSSIYCSFGKFICHCTGPSGLVSWLFGRCFSSGWMWSVLRIPCEETCKCFLPVHCQRMMRPGQGPQTRPGGPQLRAGLKAHSCGSQKSQLDTTSWLLLSQKVLFSDVASLYSWRDTNTLANLFGNTATACRDVCVSRAHTTTAPLR